MTDSNTGWRVVDTNTELDRFVGRLTAGEMYGKPLVDEGGPETDEFGNSLARDARRLP